MKRAQALNREQVLNREQTVNNLPGFLIVLFIVSACAQKNVSTVNETKAFEFYAKAALYELCNEGISDYEENCKQIYEHLLDLQPEIYFFEDAKTKEVKQVLVMFELNDSDLYVILIYDRYGFLKFITRSIIGFNCTGFNCKQKFIDAFIAVGDLVGDHAE